MVNHNLSRGTYVIILIIVVLLALSFQKDERVEPIPGEWDISDEVSLKGYEIYLIEESDFDYSNPLVYNMAKQIKSSTSSVEEAIKDTIKTVADTISYSSKIDITYCYNEKASTVAEAGFGDCVSMSRLVTSLLRAQGIPARTMGGCLSFSRRCTPLFSTVPYLEPQVTEMVMGDFKKRGYLHEWVEIWTPEKDWRIAEATSGQLYEKSICNQYLEYGYDTNQYDRCTISSSSFWESCRQY